MSEILAEANRAALVGHRSEAWRVDLLTLDEAPAGTLDGVTGGSFDLSIFNTIRTGGSITVKPQADVDWLTVRVQPWYTMTTSFGEVSWPLGVFIPASPVTRYTDEGPMIEVELYDKLLILDQEKVPSTYTVDAGVVVTEALTDLIESAGETRIDIEESDETLAAPMVWEAGTSKLRIANDLLDAINYFSLSVDGFGVYRAAHYTAPEYRGLIWDFVDDEEGIYASDFSHDEDFYDVPNRVIAISRSDGETEALTSVAMNEDPDSRFSYQARGYRWVDHVETDVEATSQAVLDSIAQRRLTELSQVSSTFEIKHAHIPLDLNAAVTFRRRTEDISVRAVIQKMSVSMELGALVTTTLREVAR